MVGDSENTVKMCVKCTRLLPLDTIACPSCGGIVFKIVDLDGED